MLRRLRLPLPLTERTCRCRRILDPLGDHRAACSRAGVLRSRGVPLEHAAARVCREAGARVTMHTRLNQLNIPAVNHMDDRAIEVIANGLPLWQGSQLAVDTTLVSPPHKCSRTTAERGQVRRDSLARCTPNKRTHLPRIGGGRDGADWWSWRWKSVGDGARRQHSSSDCWHKPKHSQPPSTCDKQLSQPSFPGGRPFWPMLACKLSHRRCSPSQQMAPPMVKGPCPPLANFSPSRSLTPPCPGRLPGRWDWFLDFSWTVHIWWRASIKTVFRPLIFLGDQRATRQKRVCGKKMWGW